MPPVEPAELAGALTRLAKWAQENTPKPESVVRRRLHEHLEQDPRELPVVSRAFPEWDRPNFQVAIDAWSAGRDVEVAGLPIMHGYRAGLAELARGGEWLDRLELGPVEHVTVPLAERESITCIRSGLWLAHDDGRPVVLLLKSDEHGMEEGLSLEVMSAARGDASGCWKRSGTRCASATCTGVGCSSCGRATSTRTRARR